VDFDEVISAQQSETMGCMDITIIIPMTDHSAVKWRSVQNAEPKIPETGMTISVQCDRFVLSFVRVFVAFSAGTAKGRVVIPTTGGEPESANIYQLAKEVLTKILNKFNSLRSVEQHQPQHEEHLPWRMQRWGKVYRRWCTGT
jgi:hypothetical protein